MTLTGKWYFGWNIVGAAAMLTLLSMGMRLGVGPFFLPITHDLGFSRSLLASIVAVGMLCFGLAMPVAGYLVARHGTRFVLLLGTAIVVVAAVWSVTARDPVNFLLAFGVLLSIGLAFVSPVALTPVISHWFTRRRGMALFFLSTGSMAGMAIMTPVFALAIDLAGWRMTLLGFAAAFAAFAVPVALFVMRDDAPEHTDLALQDIAAEQANPAAPAQSLKVREVMGTRPFWQIFLGLFACGFSMNLLGTHGMPMLMDHGYDAFSSSLGIGLIGLVAIVGTVALGRVADRVPRRKLLALIYSVRGLSFFALVLVGTHFELYVAASIGGLVWAGAIALSSAMLADVYGVRLVGVLYGLAYIGHQLGGMVSAWLGGWGYETYGTHWIAFGSAGILLMVAAALSLRLPLRGYTLMGSLPQGSQRGDARRSPA
jgi:MFS family permease